MTPRLIINSIVAALLLAFGVWIAMHTHWVDVPIRTPLQGAALNNRFYSLEHVAHATGVRTQRLTSVRSLPLTRDALYLENFNDEFGHVHLDDLEKWVERGGRLIVPVYLLLSYPDFGKWAGLRPRKDSDPPLPAATISSLVRDDDSNCHQFEIVDDGVKQDETLSVCTPAGGLLYTVRTPQWSASFAQLLQAVRMRVGKGSVVILNGWLLDNRELLRGDHARLFYAATGLRSGERLTILDYRRPESFPALLWRLASAALVFMACACAFLIWRQMPRFGPLTPLPDPVRRSLAEQIRANAAFTARTGVLGALRAAVRRALDQTAAARIAGYEMLDIRRRVDTLAAHAGIDAKALNAAMTEDAAAGMKVQRSAIALLEYTRRILKEQARKPRNP